MQQIEITSERPETTRERPEATTDTVRYFIIAGPPDVLAKIDDDTAYAWRNGSWERDGSVAREISAYDGDSDAQAVDAAEARRFVDEEQPTIH